MGLAGKRGGRAPSRWAILAGSLSWWYYSWYVVRIYVKEHLSAGMRTYVVGRAPWATTMNVTWPVIAGPG